MTSPQRRQEILDALRRGTVPRRGLDSLAVGLGRFSAVLGDELDLVKSGGSVFKAVRGEYGSGKTFFARWLQEEAMRRGFAVSEVQISEAETPLHRLETVYRRMMEHLATSEARQGAFRTVLDAWIYALEEDVLAAGEVSADDHAALVTATDALVEKRLAAVTRSAPSFAAALRAYRKAQVEGESAVAEGLLAWLSGQPNVGYKFKQYAGLKGDVDHFGALSFLQGLLTILRDSGRAGMLLVLDEVETLQRVRSDVREKGLNALRQFLDEIDAGRFPGLYLLVTGTPAFYDGPQGVKRLPPLAQRLHTDFDTEPRFDNPRAVQLRLPGFDLAALREVGGKVRDLYAHGSGADGRIRSLADDAYIETLARAVAGNFGGNVHVAPRVFLKKLVADVLDRIELHEDFDPRKNYSLTLQDGELSAAERAARDATSVDDIELDT